MSMQYILDDNVIPKYITSKHWFGKFKTTGFFFIIIVDFRRKLKCINSASLRRARRCVKTLTMPLRQTLTGLYMQNKTDSYDARRLACM